MKKHLGIIGLCAISTTVLAFEPDVILDDSDTEHFELAGSWQAETTVTNAFRGGSRVTAGTAINAGEFARFHTFLPKTGPWRVFIWHNGLGGTGFADNPVATIISADPAPALVEWNSRGSAGEWRQLGVFRFDSTIEAEVKLPHNDTGKISADAIRFSFADPEAVVEANGSATDVALYPGSSSWPYTATSSGFNMSTRRSATTNATATFTPSLPAAGYYDVSVWIPQSNGPWIPAGGTMAAAIPLEVHHRTGVASFNVTIPTTGANEGGWVRIGSAPFLFDKTVGGQSNPAKVVIKTTGVAGQYVPADAVRFMRVGAASVFMDNDDPAGVIANPSPGTWSPYANPNVYSWEYYKMTYFGANMARAHYADAAGNSRTYTPALPASGLYDTYVWYGFVNTTSSQGTSVSVNSTQGEVQRIVNQRLDGGKWNHTGRYLLDPQTAWLRISSNPASATYTYADGVLFLQDGDTTDADNDGLPDAWEQLLGTNTDGTLGGSGYALGWDTDGDGLSDGYEYGLGLDPNTALLTNNPQSVGVTVFTPLTAP